MKVGIIGKGKMGLDLFNVLLEYEHLIVLICRNIEDIDILYRKTEKILSKKFKRGFIDEAEFNRKLHLYIISTDYKELRDCDIVFESVVENLEIKQVVLKRVEAVVREDCVLATNTSSLDMNQVFKTIKNKFRCLGVHFFYPIKIISTVEINKPEAVDEKYVNITEKFLKQIGRNILILSREGNLILSKVLTTIVSYAYAVSEEELLSINQINSMTKDEVMLFGPFEIVDSTGLLIIMNCLTNFSTKRYQAIYKPLYDATFNLWNKNYTVNVGNEEFLDAELNEILGNRTLSEEELSARKETSLMKLKVVLLNELAHIVNRGIVRDSYFLDAVKEAIGLSKHPKALYQEIGEEAMITILSQEYEKKQLEFFQPENFELYKV